MSDNVAQYIIKAQDDATSVLQHITGAATDLRGVMLTLATAAGPLGTVVMTALAIGSAAAVAGSALANTAEQLNRLSQITGVSEANLQVMQRVIQESGGDTESLNIALVKLNKAIQDGNPLLKAAGVTSTDTFTAFMQLAQAITTSTDAKARDKFATELLGKSGAQLIPELVAMQQNFKGTNEQMEKAGSLMQGDTLAGALALGNELDQLTGAWTDLATVIQKLVVPSLTESVMMMTAVLKAAMGIESITDGLQKRAQSAYDKKSPAEKRKHLLAQIADEERALDGPRRSSRENAMRNLVVLRQRLIDLDKAPAASLGGASGPDALAASLLALEEAKGKVRGRGGKAKPAAAAADPLGYRPFSSNEPGGVRGEIKSEAAAEFAKAMEEAGAAVRDLKDHTVELEATVEMVGQTTLLMMQSVSSARYNVQADMTAIAADVIGGTTNIREAWHSLMRAILSDLAQSAAEFGVSLLFDFIPIPGAGAGGGKLAKNMSASPARGGGDTYNISALSARDVLEELTSPTGSMRNANDYVRTVSRASSR